LKLVDAGVLHGSQDGNGLATEFGDGNGNVGAPEIFFKTVLDPRLKLDGSESSGLNGAGQGQMDITAQIDAKGLTGYFFDVGRLQGDLVVRPEDIVARERAGLLRA